MKPCTPRNASPTAWIALGMMFLAAACGGEPVEVQLDTREQWVSETTTEGDVTTVTTISGSVWGAPASLRENLSIGVDAGG